VYRDARDVDDADDALLRGCKSTTCMRGVMATFDSSDSWNMMRADCEATDRCLRKR
jgi:hypothetical protein